MRPFSPIVLGIRVVAVLFLGAAIAGCAAGAGPGAALALVLSFGALFLAGCSESHGVPTDASPSDASPLSDAGGDAGGYWEPCCAEDGTIDSCFCPAGTACNYGWFTTCADGTCSYDPTGCPEGVDAGAPDAGGTWEPCCTGGVIDSCFCPAGVECNYGWYTDCGGGTCVDLAGTCPVSDGGAPDAGGYWEPCCVSGTVDSCFCPAGLACNYGWYTDCGGGVCVNIGETCPPSP